MDLSPAVAAAGELCAVSLRGGGDLVAWDRRVGDGALFLQLVDVAVRPAGRRRGLGRRIMAALLQDVPGARPAARSSRCSPTAKGRSCTSSPVSG
ncbi:hypothetical protein J7I44_01280 [Frateuria sp. MAH-13]|uniref:N-acetyltransferase domain-containing protein n=1 Tax=Frateuria flava TaxID=2821489 RepID=A0ABS4DIP1_9GAMM|nr:hypothetical protein [Frateuria flava]MBP1472911.1 hypothetical protein [Frateuria flava]